MKMIKTAYIRTQFWFNLISGGSVGHTIGILNGFKKNNINVKVLSNEWFYGIYDFNYKVIEPKIKKPPWLGELLYNFYANISFKKSILEFKPDFIYNRYSGYTFFVARIAKTLNIPLILEFNSFDTWKLIHWEKSKSIFKRLIQRYFLYNIVKKIEDYNLKNSYLIVTVSKTLKLSLLRIGVPDKKIMVNPNGTDAEIFNPEIEISNKCKNLRKKLGIEKEKILVGFSGTFGLWHGIPQLTEAIDMILRNRMDLNINFLIIGDGGELKKSMERRLFNYKEVTFTGMVSYSEIKYYLAICDVLVSPHCPQIDSSEFFGSPTKLFEYMAMGKGIVASNLGQIGEVLKHNESAVLVEPGNVNELAAGILKLASDDKLRLRMGKYARKEVLKKYTWERNVENLLNIMQKNKIIK